MSLRDAVAAGWTRASPSSAATRIAKAGGRTREVYAELAELGLTGLAVPEAHGGMGFGAVEAMVVMEELGRGLVNAPYACAARWWPRRCWAAPAAAAGGLAAEDRRRLRAGGAGAPGTRRALPPRPRHHHGHPTGRQRLGADRRKERGARRVTRPMRSSCRRASRPGDAVRHRPVRGGQGRGRLRAVRGYPTQDGARAAELTLAGRPATLIAPMRCRAGAGRGRGHRRRLRRRRGRDGQAGRASRWST
jgi:hypothetical protein